MARSTFKVLFYVNGSVPKYDGFCTVPEHVRYQPAIGKFLNLYEPIYVRLRNGPNGNVFSRI